MMTMLAVLGLVLGVLRLVQLFLQVGPAPRATTAGSTATASVPRSRP